MRLILTPSRTPSDFDNLSVHCRLSSEVETNPYSTIRRLALGRYYMHTGYPDLAAGEAYLCLLLLDEIEDESAEWHEQAVHAATMDIVGRSELQDERQLEDGDISREVVENVSSNKPTIIRGWERDT